MWHFISYQANEKCSSPVVEKEERRTSLRAIKYLDRKRPNFKPTPSKNDLFNRKQPKATQTVLDQLILTYVKTNRPYTKIEVEDSRS